MNIPLRILRTVVAQYPAVRPHLSRRSRLLVSMKGDISGINAGYHDAITEAIISFFDGGSLVSSRNALRRAAVEAFGESFEAGWVEGGGELPFDGDALEWFNERVEQEMGFIGGLFDEAKELKKDKDFDYFAWATARADGYTNALAAVYNAAKLLADERQMLTWNLGETEVHCLTCAKLEGQRHRASWYLSRNYIPRQPGAGLECGGYNCDCYLTNDKDEEVTI